MESLWRGFLSLRDPAGPTYRSVPSHAAGPPDDFPARPPLTDAPGRVFTRPTGFATVVGLVKTRPTLLRLGIKTNMIQQPQRPRQCDTLGPATRRSTDRGGP